MAIKREEEEEEDRQPGARPGIPVDAFGRHTIDPTRNVLDLVRAAIAAQDAARDALEKLLNEKVNSVKDMLRVVTDSQVDFQNAQRDAETKRIDQLAQTRQEFQNTIRDMLAESVRTTSNLVSTQLVQIQATFDTRVTKLEAGAFTQAGKSSVADPQLSDYMTKVTRDLNEMRNANETSIAKISNALYLLQSQEGVVGGRQMGRNDTNARMLAIVMAIAAVASPVVSILVTIMVMRGHP
jgi:DNA anti-recombination protein RmuC